LATPPAQQKETIREGEGPIKDDRRRVVSRTRSSGGAVGTQSFGGGGRKSDPSAAGCGSHPVRPAAGREGASRPAGRS